jgi:cytochrome P450
VLATALAEVPFRAWDQAIPTLDACIHETVRIISSGGAFLRRNVGQDVMLDGTALVRRGDIVLMPTADTNRNPGAFVDPAAFDPARPRDGQAPAAGLGWGGGVFACQGKRYASMVLKALTVVMLTEFELELRTPGGSAYTAPVPIKYQMFVDLGRLAEPAQLRYRRRSRRD